jgi:hypothetical protein
MRSVIYTLLLSLILVGCATPTDFHPVWMERTPPSVNTVTPVGFKTTPFEAYQRLHYYDNTYADSSKHIWHIYADTNFYYFVDIVSHPDPSSRFAFVHGIKIDGHTDLLISDDKHNYY